MKKACIDTCILIYWLDSNADPNLKTKAQQLLEDLQNKGYEIILPTPVLGEYLIKILPENREENIDSLLETFFIVPYDTKAALVNASLWDEKREIVEDLIRQGVSRQVIKVDLQIVSIAIANGCEVLYGNDGRIQKIGEGKIKVKLLKELTFPKQNKLF